MSVRSFGVGAALLAMAGHARAAAPEATPTHYALAWVRGEGAETCPAGRDFAEEVTRRLGRSPFDEHAERAIEIHVLRDAGAFTSRVYLRERDGRIFGQRTLSSGEDCAVLFSATALAVALLIDPEATLHANVNAGQAVAEFEVPTPAPLAPPPPASSPPAPPPPAPSPPPAVDRGPAALPPAAPGQEVASIALHSVLALDLVPGAQPGVELSASGRMSRRFRLMARATHTTPGAATLEGTTYAVGLTALGFSVAFDLVNDGRLSAGAEAGAWLGALSASLRSATDASVAPKNAGDFPFLAASAGLGLRVYVTRAFFLDARALALVPVLRRKLELRSRQGANTDTVWLEPAFGGLGSAGAGVSFF